MAIQVINQSQAAGTTLGYAQSTSSFTTTSTSAVQVTGISVTVTIPSGGRKIKISAYVRSMYNNTATAFSVGSIWDGTVGTGTQVGEFSMQAATANQEVPIGYSIFLSPSAGSKTYNIGLQASSGTAGMTARTYAPITLSVEIA